jgi:hypothetical protein
LRFSFILAGGHRPSGSSRLERHLAGYESSSTLMTSELESTSLGDSDEDDTMSRYGSTLPRVASVPLPSFLLVSPLMFLMTV